MNDQTLSDRIASAANYPGLYAELLGYVGQTIDDDGTIDPRWLHEYLRELKRRYVTEPVSAAIRETAHQTSGSALAASRSSRRDSRTDSD